MHKYYFKIRKGNTELEFSTDNLEDFDTKVLEWSKSICSEVPDDDMTNYERMDFIDIHKLVEPKTETGEKQNNQDFEKILNTSIEKPLLNLDKKLTESQNELKEIIASKTIINQMEYIIVVAYYLLNYENTLRFTIKQMNARLIPMGIPPVTHKELQDALGFGYIEIVPDLTGLGDVTEYALTTLGEEYYHNGL